MSAKPAWTMATVIWLCWLPTGCRQPVTNDISPQELSGGKEVIAMEVKSPVFENGAAIPAKFTGAGADISPPIVWSTPPEEAKTIALICDDPDAPSRDHPRPEGPWVHWVLYNVAATIQSLPDGIPRRATVPDIDGAKQGVNDFSQDNVGYRGPMPPVGSGPHRYFFKVYALDCELDLAPEKADKATLLAAMKGHVVAEGQLVGLFERK